jgi:hypothetical protein
MKIYKVSQDLSCWSLMVAVKDFWKEALQKHKELFALESMRAHWDAPVVYVRDPARTKRGAFFVFNPGTLVYSREVEEADLGEIIERSGELLNATLDGTGETLQIFNCLECYNCLDRANTDMRLTPDGTVAVQVHRYSFHVNRVGSRNLFKIPETKRACLYALAGRDDPEDEFYAKYHALGFTGLKFEEVWSDE